MKESTLRDILADNINLLEAGLTLLNKEQYLPNSLGTRGFIDLYARDAQGHHVLIELKRSEAASREAIHEIYKYVEGVKKHFGVRDEEIRVIIASTEWRELIVPFSRLLADTHINIIGLQILLNNMNEVSGVIKVEALPIQSGRFIAPWHDVYWYINKDNLDYGLASIHTWCEENKIEDYIVVILKFEEPIPSKSERKRIAVIKKIADSSFRDDLPEPRYSNIAYFAMQTLSIDDYFQRLKGNDEVELPVDLEKMSNEDKLYNLHMAVSELEPRPKWDCYEIGYPAKLNEFLMENKDCIDYIVRNGVFKRNTLLDDDAIISELLAEDGATGQNVETSVNLSEYSQVHSLKLKVETCLEENLAWKNQIIRIINDIEREFPEASIDVSIFNPGTGLSTILFATSKDNGVEYVPHYSIIVKVNDAPIRMYYGGIGVYGSSLTFRQLLDKYYDGQLDQLLLTLTWGGRDERDSDILDDVGGEYRSYRCDNPQDENRICYELTNERWRSSSFINPIELFGQLLEKNKQLIKEMQLKILPLLKDGAFFYKNVDVMLGEITNIQKGQECGEFKLDAPIHCSICGGLFEDEQFMIDLTKTKSEPQYCICSLCWGSHFEEDDDVVEGVYSRQNDKWLLVGGKKMVEIENNMLRKAREKKDKKKKKSKKISTKISRRKNRK